MASPSDPCLPREEKPQIPGYGDKIQNTIGSIGKYQIWLCVLIFLSKFPIAFHQMAIIFLAPPVHYVCPDTHNQTCPCPNPEYNRSLFTNTIVTEWNLICENAWYKDFTQTLFMVGVLLGSVLFGMASDRYGRRIPLIFAVVLQLVSGIVAAYAPDYWTFTLVRIINGTTIGGAMVVGFVLAMEFVGTQYRDVVSAFYQVPFNLGHMLLPAFGYFFRDYSDFQLAITLPTALLLSYFFLLPESPRWLIAVNQIEKGVKILEKVAKINKLPTENIKAEINAYLTEKATEQNAKGTIVDLLKSPNLRLNTIAMSMNWLICSYCFYGISQYVGTLSGNIFLNVAASASVTLCGTLSSIPLMKFMGRKTLIIAAHLTCTVCLLGIAVMPESWQTVKVALACMGTVSSFIVFVVVYLYSSELFPTVVRSAAVGICSLSARIGSMIAPFVVGLSSSGVWLPPVVFGVMPIIGALFCAILPETKGCELMTTIEEGENFGKKDKINISVNK